MYAIEEKLHKALDLMHDFRKELGKDTEADRAKFIDIDARAHRASCELNEFHNKYNDIYDTVQNTIDRSVEVARLLDNRFGRLESLHTQSDFEDKEKLIKEALQSSRDYIDILLIKLNESWEAHRKEKALELGIEYKKGE